MRGIYFIFLACISFPYALYGQVSGYMGKHFILKTDLTAPLLDQGYFGSLEWAHSRRYSLEIAYHTGKSRKEGSPWVLPDDFVEFNSRMVSVFGKAYGNKAYPAPRGGYWMVAGGYGRVNVNGVDYKRRYNNTTGSYQEVREEFEVEDAILYRLSTGYGVQYILYDILVIDAGFSFDIYGINPGEQTGYVENLAPYYGPNTFILYRSPTWISEIGIVRSVGVSVFFKAGILLF